MHSFLMITNFRIAYALKINLFFIQAHKNSLRILHINITFKDFAFFISRAFELFTRKKTIF